MRKSSFLVIGVLFAVAAITFVKGVKQQSADKPTAPVVGNSAPTGNSAVLSGAQLAESLKSGRPTLAEFGKGTCKICIKMAPILQQVAADYSGKANVISLDLDEFSATGYAYHIVAMPTQIFFDANGKEILRHLGYLSREEIDKNLAAVGTKR